MNASSSSCLFVTGDIYLIKRPVPGSAGIHKLFNMLCSSQFGISYDVEKMPEVWVVTLNKSRRRLSILHCECYGYGNIIRCLHCGSIFKVLLDENGPTVNLTRSQLRRLVLDGTLEGEWNSSFIQTNAELLIPENVPEIPSPVIENSA